ncbi:hypothetical protein CK203_043202 [Vitis vinifera]|uniref:Uncharacterized protein n=1 Tax=Vitis vinifera TaxID=29760 RepID=A0A438HP85_VITVI|nr:hypothetical protein CK203_043202 [Vitis vinifera]
MAIAESLTDYKRGDFSKVESFEDSHVTDGRDGVSRDQNALRMGLGKRPNVREGRGVRVNEAKRERAEVAKYKPNGEVITSWQDWL